MKPPNTNDPTPRHDLDPSPAAEGCGVGCGWSFGAAIILAALLQLAIWSIGAEPKKWVRISSTCLALTIGAIAGIRARNAAVRREQQRSPRCVSCGYNLTGNVSGVCPECGTPVAAR